MQAALAAAAAAAAARVFLPGPPTLGLRTMLATSPWHAYGRATRTKKVFPQATLISIAVRPECCSQHQFCARMIHVGHLRLQATAANELRITTEGGGCLGGYCAMSLMMVATLIIRLRRWFVCTWAKCVVDHLRPVFYRPRCKLLCVCSLTKPTKRLS